jgi:hypothetical protein
MEELLPLVSQYGVAIVIALYLVYWVTSKLDRKLDALIESYSRLNNNIEKLISLFTSKCKCGE